MSKASVKGPSGRAVIKAAKTVFYGTMSLIALFIAAANSSSAFFDFLPSEYINQEYETSTAKGIYAWLLALFFFIRAGGKG